MAESDARAVELLPFRERIGPIVGLLLLAPVSAEYLIGYDSSVADPAALLGGLVILAPLYGGPALLIREVAARTGRGWPTILALSFAAGLLQAGIIDQSLFNPDYRAIPYWSDMREPSFVPFLGTSGYMVYGFLVGHMVQSFAAPIALVEALFPGSSRRPWLGKPGMVLVAGAYGLSALAVFQWHVEEERWVAPSHLVVGAAVVVVALIVAAVTIRSPKREPLTPPGVVAVATLSLVPFAVAAVLPTDWWGVAAAGVTLVGLGGLIWRWSAHSAWSMRHVVAVAAAPLVVNAAVAFVAVPLGDVPTTAKLVANSLFAMGLAALLGTAFRRAGTAVFPKIRRRVRS